MDAAGLYREEMFTDRKVGAIRRLTPVTGDGAPDTTRPVVVHRPGGDHDQHGARAAELRDRGQDAGQAVAGFRRCSNVAIERTVQQIQELRRSRLRSWSCPRVACRISAPAVPPGRGGKIQIP